MARTLYFYCPNGHIFQHDPIEDESVSWDNSIPARCKSCEHPTGLMGPYVSESQAEFVMDMRGMK